VSVGPNVGPETQADFMTNYTNGLQQELVPAHGNEPSLEARIAELEQIVGILANHSSHMMFNQMFEIKPSKGMDDKAIQLEVRAAQAASHE
jgi:hypothetical protein